MSGGWSSAQSRIKHLGKKSESVELKNRVSVIFMDDEGNILWEEGVNYNAGVLAVPLPCKSAEEWEQKNG